MSDVIRILIGPLVWLGAFSAIYGLHGTFCGMQWTGLTVLGLPLFTTAMVLAWMTALAAQGVIVAGLRSERFASSSDFVQSVSLLTAWTGVVATLWSLSPIIATTSCG